MKTKILITSLLAVTAFVIFLSVRQGISADPGDNAAPREATVLTYDGTGGMLKDKQTGQDGTFINPQHVEIFQGDDVMYVQVIIPSGEQKRIITHKVPRNYPQ